MSSDDPLSSDNLQPYIDTHKHKATYTDRQTDRRTQTDRQTYTDRQTDELGCPTFF